MRSGSARSMQKAPPPSVPAHTTSRPSGSTEWCRHWIDSLSRPSRLEYVCQDAPSKRASPRAVPTQRMGGLSPRRVWIRLSTEL